LSEQEMRLLSISVSHSTNLLPLSKLKKKIYISVIDAIFALVFEVLTIAQLGNSLFPTSPLDGGKLFFCHSVAGGEITLQNSQPYHRRVNAWGCRRAYQQ
jgi:hypothetical protein